VATLYVLPVDLVAQRKSAPSSLRRGAEAASAALACHPDVVGVCLIGSVARGNERPDSDIDLLVLCRRQRSARQLLVSLPIDLQVGRIALLPYTSASWQRQVDRGDLFVTHVAREGVPLHDADGLLAQALALGRARLPDIEREKTRQLARLAPYRYPKRLNGNCLFALARAYSVAKAIAIARTFEFGAPTFVKDEAFATVASNRPELQPAVATLVELRPFYDLTLERYPQSLPFDYHNAEAELQAAIAAVETLVYD
jgi:predicted nucleotidyltransferase